MAGKLIESMSSEWKPGNFKDEFRARLGKVIAKRMKSKGVTRTIEEEPELPEDATTNVVDFMSLLRKSLATKKRTPARVKPAPAAKKKTVKKSTSKPPGARTSGAKAKTARKRA